MLELLQGKLSREVMSIVTDRERGLFPKPREIDFSCTCPDWAAMCKHVAAVLYGVGSRLDQHPESLFLLRGADAEELIAAEIALHGGAAGDDTLADDALAGIFGIDIDTDASASPPRKTPARARKGARRAGGFFQTRAGAGEEDGGRLCLGGIRGWACPQSVSERCPCPGACSCRRTPETRHPQKCRHVELQNPPHRQVGGPSAPAERPLRGRLRQPNRRVGGDGVPLGSRAGTTQPAGAFTERPDALAPALREAEETVIRCAGGSRAAATGVREWPDSCSL